MPLVCLAFDTTQAYLSLSGARITARGLPRLPRSYQRELGVARVVTYIGVS